MTFKEWWAKKVSILPEGLTNPHAEIVWHAAQEAMRERCALVAQGGGKDFTPDEDCAKAIRALPVE